MNERQALLAIRNAIRLEQLGIKTAAKVAPELVAAFRQVSDLLQALPPGNLERELAYKQLRFKLGSIFRSSNDAFYIELRRTLDAEVYQQVEWAREWYRTAEVPSAPGVTFPVSAAPPVGGVTPLPSGFSLGTGEITRTQLYAIAQDTEVLGKRLEQLFGIEGETSFFIRDNLKAIDRQVKVGFITGQTNEQIAKEILSAASNTSKATARAIARTSVMDMSHRAHEAFWDANSSVIAGWEFDATMDYRTCPRCAPWDGRTAVRRSDLPATPIHPNCRCARLPLTETELLMRKEEGPQVRSTVQLIDASSKEEALAKAKRNTKHAVDARAYAAKVKDPKTGKRMWKVAVDIKQPGRTTTMGDFLAGATPETQASVLGSKKVRDRFLSLTASGKTPDQALREVLPLAAAGDGSPAKTRSPRQSPAVRKIPRRQPPR